MGARTRPWRLVLGAGLVGWMAVLSADVLVLRDGRRIQGELVGVRSGVIEFRDDRGRLLRVDRVDVRRVEFDEVGSSLDGGPIEPSRPRGLRERRIGVSADVAWNDTGIDVRAGQTVYFSADGRVRWGPGRRDGPGGEDGSPVNPNRPIPSRPAAALIGRIGAASTDYFFIGAEVGPMRMRQTGRLYLGVNDDYLQDNSGSFQVTVYY